MPDIIPNNPQPRPGVVSAPSPAVEDKKPVVKPEDAPIVAPPLTLKPDEYASKLTEQRERAFAAEEKELEEKHKNEVDFMQRRHESAKKRLAQRREDSKKEVDAIKAHVELWQQQQDDLQHAPASEQESLKKRQEMDRLLLARKTGYDIREPMTGDRTIAGFEQPVVKGQPWIRQIEFADTARLHPSV